MSAPHAYIRRSATGVSGGDISREFQSDKVRELAGNAPDLVIIDTDWGKSASRQKRARRTGFDELLDAVRSGRVSTLYAYSADRLSRDTEAALHLLNQCEKANVTIVTREGSFAPGDRSARLLFTVTSASNEDYSSQASEKRHATVRVIRARNAEAGRPESFGLGGKPYGDLPGEDVQAVLDAFREAGSYTGTARILNTGDVKPRRGGKWESTAVMRVVKRGSDLLGDGIKLPVRKHRGSKTMSTHIFARLIVCEHDGNILTATNRADRVGPSVSYFCRQARQLAIRCPRHGEVVVRNIDWTWACPAGRAGHQLDRYDVVTDHPRPWSVNETVITEWAREVLRPVTFMRNRLTAETGSADEIAALQAKRARLGRAYVDGTLDEAEYQPRLEDLDAELARLTGLQRASVTWRKGINWLASPAQVNAQLRDVLHSIRLDEAMRPAGAVWLREPTLPHPDDDESVIPNPAAVRVSGGWYLPADGPSLVMRPTSTGSASSIAT